MAYCKTCGAELKDGDKFCVNCGSSVEPEAAPTGTFEEKVNGFTEKVEEKACEFGDKASETFNNVVYEAKETINSTVDNNGQVPGKGKAIASLVLGIVAIVCWFFSFSSIISVVCGIIGVVFASKLKKEGYDDGLRKAGFILSLIGLIGGAVFLVIAISCVGAIGCATCAAAGAMY